MMNTPRYKFWDKIARYAAVVVILQDMMFLIIGHWNANFSFEDRVRLTIPFAISLLIYSVALWLRTNESLPH